jgi:hypothetical protein
LIVVRLAYGGTTIGCLYNFVENGQVMFYKGGIAQFEDNRLKPGLVTHALCIAECQKRGLTVEANWSGAPDAAARRRRLASYDFLAGEGRYKEQLSNTHGGLIWVLAWRGTRMGMLERLRPPFQWAKGILRMLRRRKGIGARGASVSSQIGAKPRWESRLSSVEATHVGMIRSAWEAFS